MLLLLTVKAKETVAAVVVDQVCAVPILNTREVSVLEISEERGG